MTPKKAHSQYLQDQIQNASPEQILIMLYDGAIQALDESKKHIQDADPFEFTQRIIKAQKIIAELIGALKVDISPELVINLSRLYEFMYHHLVLAQRDKSSEKIAQVVQLLRGLRNSWKDAIETAKNEKPAPAAEKGEKEAITTPSPALPAKKPSLSFQA